MEGIHPLRTQTYEIKFRGTGLDMASLYLEDSRDAGTVVRQNQYTRASLYRVRNVYLTNFPLVETTTSIFPCCIIYQCRCNGLVPGPFTLKKSQTFTSFINTLLPKSCKLCPHFCSDKPSTIVPHTILFILCGTYKHKDGQREKNNREILNIAGRGGIVGTGGIKESVL